MNPIERSYRNFPPNDDPREKLGEHYYPIAAFWDHLCKIDLAKIEKTIAHESDWYNQTFPTLKQSQFRVFCATESGLPYGGGKIRRDAARAAVEVLNASMNGGDLSRAPNVAKFGF